MGFFGFLSRWMRGQSPALFLSFLAGRRILLVSHELSLTGAPLLLLETGRILLDAGARVALVDLKPQQWPIPDSILAGFEMLGAEESISAATSCDLIIANTAVAKDWIRSVIGQNPRLGARIVWWIHEIHTDIYGDGMECLQRVACALFDSQACLDAWRKTDIALPARARTLHPAVKEDFIIKARQLRRKGASRRSETRARLGVEREDILLSLFATYEPRKGQDGLVEAAGRLLEQNPSLPLKLLLIGFASEEECKWFLSRLTPSQRIAVAAERVLMHEPDLSPYYLASDAYVMNSQTPGEPFGRVTIEAMAFGLPVFGSAAGGTLEIIRDGKTGWLHPAGPEGLEKLAENIRAMMAGNAGRRVARSLGKAGLKRVREHFNEARFARELAAVLRAVAVAPL